ncbi:MAG: hypothetical protein NT038_06700 [Euryarchaeota archaeon]|nr:hypothetical protein [Euryarchaeota archaeon]
MKKKLIIIGASMLFLTVVFSGCQEKQAAVWQIPENILFESNILKIVNASFELKKDKTGQVKQAELIVYFKNMLDKPIDNLTLAIDFCDKNNNILHSNPYRYISSFPAGYTESTPNTFVYSETNAASVNHVNIRITDYIIVK